MQSRIRLRPVLMGKYMSNKKKNKKSQATHTLILNHTANALYPNQIKWGEMLGTPILAQLCAITRHMASCDW